MKHLTQRQKKNLEFPPRKLFDSSCQNSINLLCMQQIENAGEESAEMKRWQNIVQSDTRARHSVLALQGNTAFRKQ